MPTRSAGGAAAVLSRPGTCGAVSVMRAGHVVLRDSVGIGATDVSRAAFDIGSTAKTVTAGAVMLLAQRHKIDLHASISRYVTGVPASDRSITPAELLDHTSGLPQNFASDQRRVGERDAVRSILALRRARPGRFRYSNAGYTLLAAIVQQVSGVSFRWFVARSLLRPAGMTSTGWYGALPAGDVPVHGHVGARDTGAAGTQAPGSWATLGAGGMLSTVDDLQRWLTALTTARALEPSTLALMFRPRVALGPPGAKAAYGWVIGPSPAGPVRLVGGDTDYGFTADMRILPGGRGTTVALSCSSAVPAVAMGHDLQSTYLAA